MQSFINLHQSTLSLQIAQTYNYDGIHIKGGRLQEAQSLIKEGLEIFYSAHQDTEVFAALNAGITHITISPIFPSPQKGKPLGIAYLNRFTPNIKKHLFALGGITSPQEVHSIQKQGLRGFAGIRYFLPTH
ncbi:hypothetical protein BKH46_04975 [Helicobacter sp. 12S02634-8]|nr:hypothetical protein BKH46_04975 [Helicobacter sp. 12S02634-8]